MLIRWFQDTFYSPTRTCASRWKRNEIAFSGGSCVH